MIRSGKFGVYNDDDTTMLKLVQNFGCHEILSGPEKLQNTQPRDVSKSNRNHNLLIGIFAWSFGNRILGFSRVQLSISVFN